MVSDLAQIENWRPLPLASIFRLNVEALSLLGRGERLWAAHDPASDGFASKYLPEPRSPRQIGLPAG